MRDVLVFGTFDILHPGHAWFLRRARALAKGGRLVAVVSRDAFVRRVKGREPVFPEAERIRQLAESGLVDAATLADEEQGSYGALSREKPDLVCLGHDQVELERDLRAWLRRNGVRIAVRRLGAHRRERHSSTAYREAVAPAKVAIPPAKDGARHSAGMEAVLVFGALSLFFAAIEYLFPRPVPFMRLGLSNLPLLLAIDFMSPWHLLLVTLTKVIGQGIVNGTFASYVFVFSAASSLASLAAMLALKALFRRHIGDLGLAAGGALASNLVQAWLSLIVVFGPTAKVIIPWLLGIGTATSVVVGLLAARFRAKSAWLAAVEAAYALSR